MPQVSDHSCSEYTKPHKHGPEESEEEAENAMPVNMIVMQYFPLLHGFQWTPVNSSELQWKCTGSALDFHWTSTGFHWNSAL